MSRTFIEILEGIDADLGLAEIRANYVPTIEEYDAYISDMMMHIEQNMSVYNAFCEKFRMENPMINVTIDNLRDYEFVTRLSDKVNTITTIAFELFSLTGYGENEFYYDIYGCSQDAFATLDDILRLMNTIEI